MAFDYLRLKEVGWLPVSAGSLVVNPAGQRTYVRSIVLFNAGSTQQTVALHCVPDDNGALGSAGPSNQFYEETLEGKETRLVEFAPPGLVLEDENDSIQGLADTAETVTVQIYGGRE